MSWRSDRVAVQAVAGSVDKPLVASLLLVTSNKTRVRPGAPTSVLAPSIRPGARVTQQAERPPWLVDTTTDEELEVEEGTCKPTSARRSSKPRSAE